MKIFLVALGCFLQKDVFTHAQPSSMDLGYWHNKIVQQVHDRIKDTPPADAFEYEKIMTEEVLSICSNDDDSCRESAQNYIHELREEIPKLMLNGDSYDIGSLFPDTFHAEVREHLTNIYEKIYLLENKDLNHVLDEIENINQEAQDSELDEVHKITIESIASIAKGSSELWVKAHKDRDNVFYQLHDTNQRNLQGENKMNAVSLVTSPIQFILSDVCGGIRAAVIPSVMLIFSITNPFSMIKNILQSAIVGSLYSIGIYIPGPIDYAKCIVVEVVSFRECNITYLFGPFFDGSRLPEN